MIGAISKLGEFFIPPHALLIHHGEKLKISISHYLKFEIQTLQHYKPNLITTSTASKTMFELQNLEASYEY